jgi:hypothetical protein
MTTPTETTVPAITADQLARLVSAERFTTYLRATGDPDVAVDLYVWNARISGAFAELLQHVEVLVRNAMHRELTRLHAGTAGRAAGTAWFDSPSWVTHHWFSEPAQRSVTTAVRFAGHTPAAPRPGRVLCELGFGFWRYLASDRYEQSFWEPALDAAFAAPGDRARDRRVAVEDHLAPLHLLRNRIAHCEPIFGTVVHRRRRVAPSIDTLADMHRRAVELIGWVSPVAARWIEADADQVADLLRERP